jgi:cytochrome P450
VSVETAIDLVSTSSFLGGQPHDQFRWLRAHDPVHKHPHGDGCYWALTRYEDVRNVGRDHRTFSNWAGGNMMLYMDPPEHDRYRRLVRDPFQPDGAEAMRGRIEALAKQIIDRVAPLGECDLVTDIAESSRPT